MNQDENITALTKALFENQKGLNKVYELFMSLTDGDFIASFNAKKKELDDKINFMQKHLERCEDFVKKCEKKMAAINDLYSLRNSNAEVLSKIAAIVKILENA